MLRIKGSSEFNVCAKHRSAIVLLAVALVAFEYYYQPSAENCHQRSVAFNSWLAEEPNQDEIRLINLPMGRKSSKLYGFYQTLNGYPHAEGLAMRTPASAYDYIESNVMLNSWRDWQRYRCTRPQLYYVSVRRG